MTEHDEQSRASMLTEQQGRHAAEHAERAEEEDRRRFLAGARGRAAQADGVQSNVRLAVVPTGNAVRVTPDHPALHSSRQHTLRRDQARILGRALAAGCRARANTLESRTLTVQPVTGGVAIYAHTRPEQGWTLTSADAERIGYEILAIVGGE